MNDVLRRLDPKWHNDLLRLIETGDTSEAFLAYLESDQSSEEVVDVAFRLQSERVRGVAESLASMKLGHSADVGIVVRLTNALREVAMLSPNSIVAIAHAVADLEPRLADKLADAIDAFRPASDERSSARIA